MSYSNTPTYPGYGTAGITTTTIGQSISSASPAYTFANDINSGVILTQSFLPEVLRFDFDDASNEPSVTMYAFENGQRVKMVLAPEHDMTPVECFRLQLLINLTATSAIVTSDIHKRINALQYARKHNVARHFKLSLA